MISNSSFGIDLVFIPRLKVTQSLIERVLSPQEVILYQSRHHDIQFLAGRFAAKEAIFKVLSKQSISMCDIVILPNEEGKPIVYFPPYQLEVSISHDGDYAIAIAQWIKE
jgi:holo-[acyl-carrier protein] synthase